jgi:hypothetical protein
MEEAAMSIPDGSGGYALGPDEGEAQWFNGSLELPPPVDEQFLDKEMLKEIGARYHQEFVGPPLPPKD